MNSIQKQVLDAGVRFVSSLIGGVAAFALAYYGMGLAADTSIVFAWDGFGITLLAFCIATFSLTPPGQIRQVATAEDPSRTVRFLTVLVGACVSLLGIILLQEKHQGQTPHLLISVAAVTLSWLLIHATFCFRYAHAYYADHKTKKDAPARGIDFNDDLDPDYWDFAYFAFTVGMTAQVSDTNISGRQIRRLVLLHGLISFAYNTVIIALTISILSGIYEK